MKSKEAIAYLMKHEPEAKIAQRLADELEKHGNERLELYAQCGLQLYEANITKQIDVSPAT